MFNTFINDLFYFIKEVKLSSYGDDNQLYFADTDPAVVEHVVNKEFVVVYEWFRVIELQPCGSTYPELVIIVFKTVNNYPPEFLRDLFRLRDNIKNLRGVNQLQVPKPNATRYRKNS